MCIRRPAIRTADCCGEMIPDEKDGTTALRVWGLRPEGGETPMDAPLEFEALRELYNGGFRYAHFLEATVTCQLRDGEWYILTVLSARRITDRGDQEKARTRYAAQTYTPSRDSCRNEL